MPIRNYAKIILTERGRYWLDTSGSIEMCNLGNFLASDMGCGKSWFRQWVVEETSQFYGGNITDLEREGDFIIVSDQYSEQPDGGPYFRIPKQEFIRLLDEWSNICKQKPQEVFIEWDGKQFTITMKK